MLSTTALAPVSNSGLEQVLARTDRLLKILDSMLLACETTALLMVQPSELLQDLGMVRISIKDAAIGVFGRVVLFLCQQRSFILAHVPVISRLSAVRAHDLSETRYPLQSRVSEDLERYR